MKRILGLILVFCLVFSFFAEALAEPKWEITEQPTCKATKKTVTLSIKVKGKGIKYQWVFVNPEDPDDTVTGKNLAKDKRFKGIKVAGYTKNKIVLSKVPEALHGWSAYCHLYSNAYKMDSEPVVIELFGMDSVDKPEKPASDDGEGEDTGEDKTPAEDKEDDGESGEDEGEEPAADSRDFTVSANGKYLFKVDSMGNPEGDEAVSSLTFTDSGNVAVRSEEPFKSWTVNGVRFEPDDEITGFKLFNLSADTSISLKKAVKTAATANVDESVVLKVTCQGCSFTYLPKGLKRVTSGDVPSGALIYVFADSYDSAANGYVINGGEPQNLGAASMQVTITEDTEIVVR